MFIRFVLLSAAFSIAQPALAMDKPIKWLKNKIIRPLTRNRHHNSTNETGKFVFDSPNIERDRAEVDEELENFVGSDVPDTSSSSSSSIESDRAEPPEELKNLQKVLTALELNCLEFSPNLFDKEQIPYLKILREKLALSNEHYCYFTRKISDIHAKSIIEDYNFLVSRKIIPRNYNKLTASARVLVDDLLVNNDIEGLVKFIISIPFDSGDYDICTRLVINIYLQKNDVCGLAEIGRYMPYQSENYAICAQAIFADCLIRDDDVGLLKLINSMPYGSEDYIIYMRVVLGYFGSKNDIETLIEIRESMCNDDLVVEYTRFILNICLIKLDAKNAIKIKKLIPNYSRINALVDKTITQIQTNLKIINIIGYSKEDDSVWSSIPKEIRRLIAIYLKAVS